MQHVRAMAGKSQVDRASYAGDHQHREYESWQVSTRQNVLPIKVMTTVDRMNYAR